MQPKPNKGEGKKKGSKMEQEMCIQFTVFLCNLNSAPCMHYDAVSNYGITYVFFSMAPLPSLLREGSRGGPVKDGVACVGRLPCMVQDLEGRE